MAGSSRPTFPQATCNARASVVCSAALLLVLHSVVALVSAQGSTAWPTLSGNAPLVIARGGFSGLFPDSSLYAYNFALVSSLPNVVLWCDVQLTKDSHGICFPDIKLDNASDISNVFKNRESTYSVNGALTKGIFSPDFTLKDLSNVFLTQGIYSRTSKFDGNLLQILTVEDVATQFKPPGFWLNIQNDAFYKQRNLSMRTYILGVSRRVIVNYISSPDIGFLRSIVARFNPSTTKLVFRFLGSGEMEPSTNQTYGSLLTNLTFIKTFASGILVPKTYIWPVNPSTMYLLPHTSVVSDAHNAGLEVYASDFVNDVLLSYHYSYDPLAEYLNFVDNGNFSVDGVLSDFPLTPSAAIDCFSHLGNDSAQVGTLVITKNGASGDFPGCTDFAYTRAVSDGADILDCPVQMSKDGMPFCLGSIDLVESTSVAQSQFNNRSATIPAIKAGTGTYTFSLTWAEIQSLKSTISSPYSEYLLYRNPGNNGKGKFLLLSEFLALTKNTSSLFGVLISIENAAYLAKNQGLGVTEAVLDALSKAGYNKTTQKVMIQSTNSSVLMKFKEKANYELVYRVDEGIRDALPTAIDDIKTFADSVVIGKSSIFTEKQAFLTGATDIVSKLHKANLSVYAETFSNEFISQAWDFFSDATVEINSYVVGAKIDGVITDFPKTAASYKRNRCLNLGDKTPPYMSQVEPGSLLTLIPAPDLPPVGAPLPVLTEADVAEAPLPPVSTDVSVPAPGATPPTAPKNDQSKSCASSILLSGLGVMLAALCLKL